MNWKVAVGIGYTAQEGEQGLLQGYNASGAQLDAGSPVCWGVVQADGVSVVLPAAAGFQNFSMFAGILKSTVGTAEYCRDIVAYGKVNANAYGIATTYIPGAGLVLVDGKDYVAYGSAGQFAGSTAVQQPISLTALATNTTANERLSAVFVKAL